MRQLAACALLLVAAPCLAGIDANEVGLGAPESLVKQRFPNAHCQPLQWPSHAADRRCDESRVRVANIEARVTFYLKDDAVEAFDVRFDSRDLERFVATLTARFGKPVVGSTEKLTKLQWRDRGEQAVLSTEPGKRRASLFVWRGEFDEEIYKVR